MRSESARTRRRYAKVVSFEVDAGSLVSEQSVLNCTDAVDLLTRFLSGCRKGGKMSVEDDDNDDDED